jgi:flagellar basal body-associated protein FliL
VRQVEPEAGKKKSFLIPAIAAVVLLAAVVVGYLVMRSGSSGATVDSYVVINAVPWATVKSVEPAGGGAAVVSDQQTPLRVALPAGTYKVTLMGPNNTQRIDTITVGPDKPGNVNVVFEEIDVDSILQAH